jgi:hypothetical protein
MRLEWASAVDANTFIHSVGKCRMRQFLAVLRSFFHSSLLYNFFLPLFFSNYSSIHPHFNFLGLPLGFVVSKFIYSTLLGILFSSVLCTCPYQRNLCTCEHVYTKLWDSLRTILTAALVYTLEKLRWGVQGVQNSLETRSLHIINCVEYTVDW